VDRRAWLEPGSLGPEGQRRDQPVPHRRRTRFRAGRPPGLARTGRWARRLGQQRRAQGRRHHCRHQGPGRRHDPPPRRWQPRRRAGRCRDGPDDAALAPRAGPTATPRWPRPSRCSLPAG
jgi:hypothetical protein